jgi:3-oxoacyl-[acyl-carrier protein] reductase
MSQQRKNNMPQSVAIVTGASSGIGRATALRLARDFGAVVLVARSGGKLNEAAHDIEITGAKAFPLELDLMAPEAAESIVKQTTERFGRINALVNIAGAVPGIDLFQMTDAQWDAGMALKFHGARRLTLQAWPSLKASGGAVVFMSGNAAEIPKPGAAAVGTINAAIEALSRAFAERGIEDGVQVNSISPGAVITSRRLSMLEKAAQARAVTLDEAQRQFLKQAGISRFGEAAEIAEAIAFMVSPAARWMTGTVLRMDGGEVKSV